MKVAGLDVVSGAGIEVRFGATIEGVDAIVDPIAGDAHYLAPGFIDLQVNGFAGVDYNNPAASQQEISRSIRKLHSTGVTRFYPTVITGRAEDMLGALRNLTEAKRSIPEGSTIEGFHVEGPHICPDDGPRGAHPQHCVRPPDLDEYRRWQEATGGLVRLVTLSPEWPEAPKYIEAVARDGTVVSIGHTKATAEQIQAAVSAGATMSTHIGNGAHGVMQRHPNYIWEQLAEDRLAAGMIVDGIHLGPAFLKVALRAKGLERAVLVTDAAMPAGCEPGPYRLGEVDVELLPGNRVVLRGGTRLAGSALHMHEGVANLMRIAGLSLTEAVTLATRNPARVGRIASRQKGLAPGDRADFVLFHHDRNTRALHVLETWVDGVRVYDAG